MRLQFSILLSLLYLLSCTPKQIVTVDYSFEEDNHTILKSQMNDSLFQAMDRRHVKRRNRVIKTKKEAIKLAKPVFSNEFGKDYNIEERLYTVHHMNGFWIVRGHLPNGYTGGTLVAVIDSESGKPFCTLIWK